MNAKHKPLVVIAAAPKAQLSEVSVHVKDIAKQWKDSKAAGDVIFTWMDADKWTSWLKSMYGISAGAGAQVVIADHTVSFPPRFKTSDTDVAPIASRLLGC